MPDAPSRVRQEWLLVAALLLLIIAGLVEGRFWLHGGRLQAAGSKEARDVREDWPVYGGSAAQDRYSPLRQIDRKNVQKLKVAWTFDTAEPGALQTNPLIVGHVLFGY